MSEATTFDSMGNAIATGPPSGNRRGHWVVEAKTLRNPAHCGKFWTQKKADLTREAETILGRAQSENRDMSAGETAWFDGVMADVAWVQTEHLDPWNAAQERLKDSATPHNTAEALNGEGLRAKLSRLQQTPGPTGRRYSDLFGASDLAGFRSSAEFFNILASGLADPRMVQQMTMYGAAGTMQEVGVNNGSAVVPSQMVREWWDGSLESEIVRPRCRIFPAVTDSLKVAGIDFLDNSGSAPGGFRATWSQENDDAVPQLGKFRAVEFHMKKLKLYSEASAELSQDGVDFDSQIGDAMMRAIGWGLDDSLLVSGTGAGQPLSVLNDPSLIVIPKESGQAAQTIVYENILKMFSRLHPASMTKAVWVVSSTAIPQLLSMVLGIGSAGVFLPATKEADGRFTLLGLPLLFTEKVPSVGIRGDILLIDFSQYGLALRKEMLLEKSNLPGWSRDVMSYRVILRADGKGLWGKPSIPKTGSSEARSWCVALATRG